MSGPKCPIWFHIGSVVDASDQVMGFAVAKVPLEREFCDGELKEESGRGKRQKTEKEEEKKKSTGMFFFLSSGTKLYFRTKLVSFKMFWT